MANNRLYMRCKSCGRWMYLSKNFMTPYYITVEKCYEINRFFEQHAWCSKRGETYHDGGHFEFIDEFAENFDELLKPELFWAREEELESEE